MTRPKQTDTSPSTKSQQSPRLVKNEQKQTSASDEKPAEPRKPETSRKAPAPKKARRAVTPPHPGVGPDPENLAETELGLPELYLNRELTWLNFNYRVLHEAADPRTPLLERVKFVSIVSSNLDEFFMKRIGGLKQQVGAGMHDKTVDGRTPHQQITECYELVRELENDKRKIFENIDGLLAKAGIRLTSFESVGKRDQAYLREFYLKNIYPLVTPQVSDPAHPFPFISNLSLNLLVTVSHPDDQDPTLARVKIPVGPGIPRMLKLEDKNVYVTLESVMANNLDLLFPDLEILSCEQFRVTRNSNTEKDEEGADDLMSMIETELRDRRFAPIVRLEIGEGMDPVRRGMLAAELGLDEHNDVFEVKGFMAMRDLMQIATLDEDPALSDTPHHPIDHPDLPAERSLFHTIRDAGSILLMHPYESFGTSVERFLREASQDPKVQAIKMTLYRTSSGTRAVEYLTDAALNGKQVTVVVELKARFDEAANIRWANRLERAGAHVTYGVVGLKTHCKSILVVRRDYDGLRRYAHIGTGNYHAGTARLYSDLGLLTSDNVIGEDLTELFNYLTTGFKPKRNYRKIFPAPKVLKRKILHKIQREIDRHTPDSPGRIVLKTNALEDIDVTQALYRASQGGIRVDLIVRDTCRLRPGIPGLSENIRVISVVGRFLEHARIMYFRNAGKEEYFLGSADFMKRNLDSRVEVFAPVESEPLRAKLRHFLDAQLQDQRSVWEMRADGSYIQRRSDDESAVSSQQAMIEWTESELRRANRLRRRKPRSPARRKRRG